MFISTLVQIICPNDVDVRFPLFTSVSVCVSLCVPPLRRVSSCLFDVSHLFGTKKTVGH